MNIEYLGKCSERQHKATLALAQQLVGLPAQLIPSLPIVVRRGETLIFHSVVQGPTSDMDYVNPYIMNGSFALELRLKYLHALETGQRMDNSHNLKDIFDALTHASKVSIRSLFGSVTNGNPTCKQISRILNEHKVQFRWDIEFLLGKSSLAFERWRYIYELKGDIAWFCGYSQIKSALDMRIAEIGSAPPGAA